MIYRHIANFYRLIDHAVLRRGPVAFERAVKGTAFRIAKVAFPHRLVCATTEMYLSHALAHRLERRSGNGSVQGQVPQPLSGMREGDGREAQLSVVAGGWAAPALPEWARTEMEEIAQTIDPAFHSSGPIAAALHYYGMPLHIDGAGTAYARLRRLIKGQVDMVILVPWLKHGGADLGAIHFANALQHQFGKRVLVVATEASDSPWAHRLSKDVQFLEAGAALEPLSPDERRLVLVRLMLQLAPQTIHLMNSNLGWQVVAMHAKALRHTTRLFASLYCDDVSPGGMLVGYAQSYLMDCYESLDGVVSDNGVVGAQWARSMGVPVSLFHVVPFPAREPAQPPLPAVPNARTVLWAGRLDRQKRPDILLAIAKAMPEWTFDVYGQAVIDGELGALVELQQTPNVRMRGAFSDFYKIVRPDHLALLYTTQWDGMPNIVLEAAKAGLPVVAPALGGIGEFIPAEWLIDDCEHVAGFVAQLRRLADEPALRAQVARTLSQRVDAMHSYDSFVGAIAALPRYLDQNQVPAALSHTAA